MGDKWFILETWLGGGSQHNITILNVKGHPSKHNKHKADEIHELIKDKDAVIITETGVNANNKLKINSLEFKVM